MKDRTIRRIWKKICQRKGRIFVRSLMSGVSLVMILDMKRRLDKLESRLDIVTKRGALFMANLQNEVQKQGYMVAHIKTDSIKTPDNE